MSSNAHRADRRPPLLVPTPRSIKVGRNEVAAAEVEHHLDVSIRAGGYRLVIAAGAQPTVRVASSDPAGRRHALATLAQLRTQYGDRLPELEIQDEPAFAVRGVMLDISRDRVPTMRQLFETIDLLASLKFNHLQLYTEHTFAYAGHEDIWRGWSPMTADQVRRADAYCRERGIELAANQNCFGHLGKWLALPRYAGLAETHGDWMFDGTWPMSGPFSLCPTDPRSIELVRDLLGQLLPCVASPLVNIGCDETFDIEFGRSGEECSRRGRAAVYLDFVRQICEAARSFGKRPMFWADIALSHPECIPQLPEDLVSLAWGYEPDAPFDRWCERVRAAGREVWVCPGTSTWRSITGRTTERRENLMAAAAGGLAHGATGFLVTDWGDTGHHQQWPLTMHALAQAAQAAWGGPHDLDTADASSLQVLGDRSLRAGRWLDEFGDADLPLRETCGKLSRPDRTRLRNQTALFIDLLTKPRDRADVGTAADWRAARDRIADLMLHRPHGIGPGMTGEIDLACEMALAAADRGAWRRAPGGLTADQRADLCERLEAIVDEHRRTWLARSRSGGLESSCGHLRRVINQMR